MNPYPLCLWQITVSSIAHKYLWLSVFSYYWPDSSARQWQMIKIDIDYSQVYLSISGWVLCHQWHLQSATKFQRSLFHQKFYVSIVTRWLNVWLVQTMGLANHVFCWCGAYNTMRCTVICQCLWYDFFCTQKKKFKRKNIKRKDLWRHNEETILCETWITITTDETPMIPKWWFLSI